MEEKVEKRILTQFHLGVENFTPRVHAFIASGEEVAFAKVTIDSDITVRNDGLMVVGKLTNNGKLINNGILEVQPEWA